MNIVMMIIMMIIKIMVIIIVIIKFFDNNNNDKVMIKHCRTQSFLGHAGIYSYCVLEWN